MQPQVKRTMHACFLGYIVQAIVNNFVPLLFVTFGDTYGIPLSRITLLITFNFLTQLLIDFLSAGLIDKIGYRASVILSMVFSFAGLSSLTFLPEVLPDAFAGLLISVFLYAVGGGLAEVIISPIVEACPTENKEKAMSLLHSFYCWGHVGVVLLSTLYFSVFGVENWKILALLWAAVPIVDLFLFLNAPIYSLADKEEGAGLSAGALFSKGFFWLLLLMMLCAGAAEQSVSQWSSAFAERGLGISKTAGDLAGPMAFALLMGLSRLLFGKCGDRLPLKRCMLFSTLLCVAAYLCIALIPSPVAGLIGCALCGFSVGIFWPGTYSIAAAALPGGGTAMFAFLALAGDLGCTAGPTLAGLVSGACGDNLRTGILCAVLFPALMLLSLLVLRRKRK